MPTVIISSCSAIVVALISLWGIKYQTNKNYEKAQAQAETDRILLKQQFEDYQVFLHQINKDLKEDIEKLSDRVDEHNSYGRKIPVLESKIDDLTNRVSRLEDK